jgi:signal transduction histidine kinase
MLMRGKITFSTVLAELDMIKAELDCNDKLMNVYNIFESNYNVPGIIIMRNGIFYSMLSKTRFYQVMSKQYMFDLFSRRSVLFFFDDHNIENYLILDESVSIIEAAGKALQRNEKDRYEPLIVISSNGNYKLLPIQTLLMAQNAIQAGMLKLITEANEFKKDVFRIVAHDLRNPLAVVIGYTSLMLGNDFKIEHLKSFAENIHSASNNMNNLINDFLVSAINDSTDFDLHYSTFNISIYLEKIIKSFENSLLAKRQEITLHSSATNIHVKADRNKITEVIENLISNAIKYSEYDTKIIVEVSSENDKVRIKVLDEGPGLTEDDKDKVFNKFQKLSAKPTGNESSTGLGLYIAKRIIDRHDGQIWVESEYGKGSAFFISLPVFEDALGIINGLEKSAN